MTGKLVAYIGSYRDAAGDGGGITVLDVSRDGRSLTPVSHVGEPKEAGYLAYVGGTLYAVDERKNDGRGPVEPAASVHAFTVDQGDGSLTWLNARRAPGPRPTFLCADEAGKVLVTANHGDFEHVERVVRTPEGGWDVEYLYDDSTVILYGLEDDGSLGEIRDLHVFSGHGKDPNGSPQAGGHAQASPHAHCAVIDPSGRHVLVCDKGTDQIFVFALGDTLEPEFTYRFEEETGPRHLAFEPGTGRVFVTCEFSSELVSFDFDASSGKLRLLDRVSTVASGHTGGNEPAEVRVHPRGGFVYVNNRGEDSLAWFHTNHNGQLLRLGHVPLARSLHPGVAARSFAFDPSGSFLLLADRPAGLVRSFAVDAEECRLRPLATVAVAEPSFVAFAELP
ncbi:lactonase family protein [Amycolatopsis acidicola]|uniref:Lactonase family protein n=1 Tax=Amycolatopsis acidicola TaxID=2596893 RepID=A0A5N0VH52_9PSEU|nr:beta-propeller fold lactonase family protein [Amycolatopsis acidicola]KAA9165546.1 lactonase family protein [Amycolatopsis acidicola]